MANPSSIALSDLSEKIAKSAADLDKRQLEFLPDRPQAAYFPDPGIIGYILRKDLQARSAEELVSVADGIAERLGPSIGIKQGKVLIDRGGILVGFFPIDIQLR